MRLHDKHLIVTMNKEVFHVNFNHFMNLDGNYQMMEKTEEFGMSVGEVKIMRKNNSRT